MDKIKTHLESIRSIILSNIKHFQFENPLEFETYNFKYNHQGRLSSEYDFDTVPNKHYKLICSNNMSIRFDTTEQGTWMLTLSSTNPYYKFVSNRVNEPILPIDNDFFKILDKVMGLVSCKPGYISDFRLVDKK